jgi:hypothetical protein
MKYLNLFFQRRSENDYDFVTVNKPSITVNIDLYDIINITSEVAIYESSGLMRFDNNVHVDYFDKRHIKIIEMNVDKAFFDVKNKVWLFQGYIEIKTYNSADQKIFNTDMLFFDQNKKIFFNNSPVKFTDNNFVVDGDNIYAKDNLNYYKIKNPKVIYNKE